MPYPKWTYPPDNGVGHVIYAPEEEIKGWSDFPSVDQALAGGERVIGQPINHVPSVPVEGAHVAPVIEEQPAAKKSKK